MSARILTEKIQLSRQNYKSVAAICILITDFDSIKKDISFLHPNEKEYYKTLVNDFRRLSYLQSRLAAKLAMLELNNELKIHRIEISFGVFNFPVVKHYIFENIQVSISHSHEICIALAFPEEHPISVDVEHFNACENFSSKALFSPNENQLINNCNIPFQIAKSLLWTAKEALSKILKTGLTIDIALLEINAVIKEKNTYVTTFSNFVQYKATSFFYQDFVFSIVSPKKTFLSLEGVKMSI